MTTTPAAVTTHFRTCPLCEAMCGLEVQVTDGTVTRIRGDRDDVWSKGYLCPKGTALGHLHHGVGISTPVAPTHTGIGNSGNGTNRQQANGTGGEDNFGFLLHGSLL